MRSTSLGKAIWTRVMALTLLLILALAAFVIIYIFNIYREETVRETNHALSHGSEVIQEFINDQFNLLETLALSREVKQGDLESSRSYMEDTLRRRPQIIDIGLISPSGREFLKVSRYEHALPESLTNHVDDDHFKLAMSGQRSFGELVYQEGLPTIAILVPVYSNSMNINGALEATVSMRFLSEWIRNIKWEQSGTIYLVDNSGIIMAHPKLHLDPGYISVLSLPAVSAALAGKEVVPYGPNSRYKNLGNERVVSGVLSIPPQGWVLVVEREEKELVYRTLPFAIGLTGSIFLAIAAASLLAAIQLRKRVIQPINSLSIVMQKFDRHKEFEPASLDSNDEIGAMSQSFNKMALDLSSTLHDLQLSQSRLTTILENVPQGVFLVDTQSQVQYANAIVAKDLNMLPGDLQGIDIKSFMQDGSKQKFEEQWEKMKKDLQPFSVEVDYATGRKRFEPGIIFLAPIPGTDGAFSGAVLLGVNLTKVKEEEKKKTREERLAFLGLLASKISHELRNPLGAMGNSIYYLKQNLKDGEDKIKRHLDMLERQVESSNYLINSILDFARPKQPVLYPVNMNHVLQQALEQVPLPPGIELERKLDPNLPAIQGDSQLLIQVFINFLTNACQAMPKGGKITLSTRIKENMVVAEVQDTGMGIEPEFMKKMFQPFQSSKARGMGLGLTISKDTVEKHGGSIEVQSQAGQGTTFSVYLPIKSVCQATTPMQEAQ